MKLALSMWLVDQQRHTDPLVRRVAQDFARGRTSCVAEWHIAAGRVRQAYRDYLAS